MDRKIRTAAFFGYGVLLNWAALSFLYFISSADETLLNIVPLFQLLGPVCLLAALGFWLRDKLTGKKSYVKY